MWAAGLAAGAVVVLALAVALAVAALERWMDTADVKAAAERAIAGHTDARATFRTLEAGFRKGLRFTGLDAALPGGVRVEVEKFEASFDLSSLYTLSLEIENVSVDRPVITLGAGPDKGAPQSEEPTSGVEPFEIPLPTVPLFIRVNSVEVRGLEIRPQDGPPLATGLDISASASLGPLGPEASVKVRAGKGASLAYDGAGFSMAAAPDMDVTVSMEGGGAVTVKGVADLDITSVRAPAIAAPGRARVEISGRVSLRKNFAGQAELKYIQNGVFTLLARGEWARRDGVWVYAADINRMSFPLEGLAGVMAERGLETAGFVNLAPLRVEGRSPETEPVKTSLVASGSGYADISRFSGAGLETGKTKLSVRVDRLTLTPGGEAAGKIAGNVEAGRIMGDGYEAGGVSATFEVDAASIDESKVYVSASLDNAAYQGQELRNIMLNASVFGDFTKGDFGWVKGDVAAPGDLRVKLFGSMSGYGREKLQMTADATMPFAGLTEYPVALPVTAKKGEVRLSVTADGKAGADFAEPDMNLSMSADVKDFSGDIPSAGGNVVNSSLSATASASLSPGLKLSSLKAKAEAGAESLSLGGKGGFENPSLTLEASSPDPLEAVFEGRLRVEGNTYILDTESGAKGPVARASLDIEGVAAPYEGRYEIRKAAAGIGREGAVKASGLLDGEKFRFESKVSGLDLAELDALAGGALAKAAGVEGLSGKVAVSAEGAGALPDDFNDIPYPLPFGVKAAATLRGGAAQMKSRGARVGGVGADIALDVSGEKTTLSGGVRVAEAAAPELFGGAPVDPTLEFDLTLDGRDRLVIDRLVFDVAELGFVETVEGTAAGVDARKLAAGELDLVAALKKLEASLWNFVSLRVDKSQRFFGDVNFEGAVDSSFTVDVSPAKGFSINGEGDLKDISVKRKDEVLVKGLRGGFPFSKTLAIVFEGDGITEDGARAAPAGAADENHSVRSAGFFTALRGQAAGRNNVKVDAVRAGPVLIEDMTLDLYFRDSGFGADYFRASLLGGAATGSARVKGGAKAHRFGFTQVFTGLDLGKLLGEDAGLAGKDAEIDGDVTINLSLEPGRAGKGIDITGIDAAAHLSRVGRKALDRLLLFLDPQESKPSIMSARLALKYATPVKVDMIARHGNMSLKVDLKYSPLFGGKTITMPVVDRFPIQSLVNFGVMREYLEKLEPVSDALRKAAATSVVMDADGAARLR